MNSEAPIVAKNRALGIGQTLELKVYTHIHVEIHFLVHQRHVISDRR